MYDDLPYIRELEIFIVSIELFSSRHNNVERKSFRCNNLEYILEF